MVPYPDLGHEPAEEHSGRSGAVEGTTDGGFARRPW